MALNQFTLIVYDTPSNKRRRRLANLLKNYMFRVQKSVFEGHFPDCVYEMVLAGIKHIIDLKEDSVRIYRLPKDAYEAIDVFGLPPIIEDQNHYFINPDPPKVVDDDASLKNDSEGRAAGKTKDGKS